MAPDTMGMVRAGIERTSGGRLSWSLRRGDRRISTGLATACMRLNRAGLGTGGQSWAMHHECSARR